MSDAFCGFGDDIEFPKPSGPYTIGYKNIELEDPKREDPYNHGCNRRLKVTVWFPSMDPLKIEPYGNDEMEILEVDKERILSLIPQDQHETILQEINQYAHLKIYKSKNAEAALGKFPVIIFSPGYMAKAISYQRILQDLVSHGYVMMSIHHPYLTDRVKFECGVVLRQEDNPDELALCTYTNDLAFVLTSLPEIADKLALSPSVDLNSMGVLGHSLGGESIMRTTHNPSVDIQAAVCLDSTHSSEGLKRQNREYSRGCEGFNCPFMHIVAGSHPSKGITSQSLKRAETEFNSINLKKNNYKVLMRQATHVCFGDYGLLKQMLPDLAIEEVLGLPENYVEENYKNTTLLLRSFFDRFLKDQTDIDLMTLKNEDVHIETETK